MFHSNAEKISLACAILRDNDVMPCLFLKKCRDAGGESFILVGKKRETCRAQTASSNG